VVSRNRCALRFAEREYALALQRTQFALEAADLVGATLRFSARRARLI